jgi:hypothetical protein
LKIIGLTGKVGSKIMMSFVPPKLNRMKKQNVLFFAYEGAAKIKIGLWLKDFRDTNILK